MGRQPAPLETAEHLGLAPLDLDLPVPRSASAARPSVSRPLPSRPLDARSARARRPVRGFWQYLMSFLVVPLRGSGIAWICTTGALMVAGSVVCGLLGLGLFAAAGLYGLLLTYLLASVLCASLYFAYFRAAVMAAMDDEDRLGPVTLASNSVPLGAAAVAWNGLLFGLAALVSFGPLLARGVEAIQPEDVGGVLLHTWPIWYAATIYAYFANALMAVRQDWRAFVGVIPFVRLAMHSPLQFVATVIAIHVGSLVAAVPYVLCGGIAFALRGGVLGLSLVAGVGLFSGIYAIGTAAVAMGNLFRANAADVGEMNRAQRH